jgi:hypothetical protein
MRMQVKVDAANRRLLPSTAVPSPSLRDSVSRRDVHYRNAKQLKKAVQLQINRAELVFFEPSPDYCEHDHKAGNACACNYPSTHSDGRLVGHGRP